MDFTLTGEQQQLRDTLLRYVQKDYNFDHRRAILKSAEGISRDAWKQLAEMGITALGLPEEHGGIAGNALDTALVMEVLGRGLVVEPYFATVVLGARLIALAGSAAQQAALLPQVAAGERLLALAHLEAASRYETTPVAATAKKQGTGYVLNGTKTVVLHGAQADTLIVSARTAGQPRDTAGLSLFLVDRKAAGVAVQDHRTHDGQRAAEITLKNAPGELLGAEGAGHGPLEHALDHGIAALCAEAVGAMGAAIEITLAYVKQRKQFGVAIGSFQALQHRMADMFMAAETARSMMYLAASKADVTDAAARRRALSAAKAHVGQAARYVGQQAVQLHGGIGVTDEAAISHYFKRLTLIDLTLGDADHHLGRFSDTILKEVTAAAPASARAA
ncbi:MAG TPA: acyl-CoA dehydrogenase family protein [Candidatus Binatia bacterium]|nr:acyl-CoA dehydrogenase family protein [Candidatus Binatia bacterium]